MPLPPRVEIKIRKSSFCPPLPVRKYTCISVAFLPEINGDNVNLELSASHLDSALARIYPEWVAQHLLQAFGMPFFYIVWHVLKRRVRHDMSLAGVGYVQVPRESEICVTCSGNLRVWHVCDMSMCPEYDMCLICSVRVWHVFDVFRYLESLTCLWTCDLFRYAEADMSVTCAGIQRVWHVYDMFRYPEFDIYVAFLAGTQRVCHVCDMFR
jgi:hypothetical protein